MADLAATEQITLTPHGTVRLISRERLSPADRGTLPYDVCQGVPARVLALPAPATVDNEERAFLTEVALLAMQELQDELDSAACAVAIAALVSLSESEGEEEALAVIADSVPAPQWTDDSHTAALPKTLTALTLAGVPVSRSSRD